MKTVTIHNFDIESDEDIDSLYSDYSQHEYQF